MFITRYYSHYLSNPTSFHNNKQRYHTQLLDEVTKKPKKVSKFLMSYHNYVADESNMIFNV